MDIVKPIIDKAGLHEFNTAIEAGLPIVAALSIAQQARIQLRAFFMQYTYKEGLRLKTGEQVVTRPIDPAVQFAALKKLSKDTGEDAVVGVQNRMIEQHLLDMGRDLLKTHQRGLMAPPGFRRALD